ncbi:E3 ubiquitin-protein ligase RNF183 [Kryptolebias marmoratus]|uniref:Probable E3 ubiquitin-protein ligase RNF183 n=1 Tax=Kryptolebias marmoratus TaxID=37003 RepID=A0A3Q3ARZ0_KRYMA|nr:E3 ubiquitin-protein ligase RNF183 [Kryptolebias marmoratus]XP_017288582.1 E3 ubiquitin-protein ligase RNF183 [Kryptolebias marmoratus]XP_037834961.1 E3 ubiquitin-protein ligase RNF183 [Kryptolebias marmoratus]
MNPDRDKSLKDASGSAESPNPYCPSSSSSSVSFIQTGLSSLNVLHQNSPSSQPELEVWSPSSILTLPDISSSSENPYAPPTSLPSYRVSISVPSPDLQPSPPASQSFEEAGPDLECSICFSQFNNIFRCPKMLHCKHTFCLECLARINVKSAEPSAIQCPLCRGLTPLPTLGLPKLTTDSDVLSYLPAAMQRVYSIRFIRNKGKLQVKRSSEDQGRLARGSLASVNRTLDVGLPSPTSSSRGSSNDGGVGGALFHLTGRPACRAFLLTSVVMMMVLLTTIIIFLLTYNKT